MEKQQPISRDIGSLGDVRSYVDLLETLDEAQDPPLLKDLTEQLVLFFATRLINIDPCVSVNAEEEEAFERRIRAWAGDSVIIWGDRRPRVMVEELILRFAKAASILVGQRIADDGGFAGPQVPVGDAGRDHNAVPNCPGLSSESSSCCIGMPAGRDLVPDLVGDDHPSKGLRQQVCLIAATERDQWGCVDDDGVNRHPVARRSAPAPCTGRG